MGEYDGLEYEQYDEFVREICVDCLKIKVVCGYWIIPSPEFLAIYTEAKPDLELSLCSNCLDKMIGIKI